MITILLVDHAIEDARSVSELLAAARANNFKLDLLSNSIVHAGLEPNEDCAALKCGTASSQG